MSSTQQPPSESFNATIAPPWHTAAVVLVMFGVSVLSGLAGLPGSGGRAPRYLLAMLIEWATVAFIWWGLTRRGGTLSGLVGGRWTRGVDALRDLGIGIAFIIVFGGAVQGLTSLLKAAPPQALTAMLPQTPLEMAVWVPLCLTAGFCEEVIFRGYLQRQFSVLTHSLVGGIGLQGIVFGLSHGYQGWKLMSIIAIYGACFGGLAHWRRSLRPGMLGHALQDTAGGLLAHFVH